MRLEIETLGKRYGSHWGLRGFTLTLEPGVTGLLGPNGAGKSTLMRMLATVTRPTEGTIRWDGRDVRRSPDPLRAVLGYLPQDFGVYPRLTAVEFLEYLAAVKGLSAAAARPRIASLLEAVNLTEARRRPIGGFSGGMRQRLGIAQALLNDPQLLIVDEPTAGLDPEERVRFRHLLSDLSGNRIVLLSTHVVSDVESIADRIAVVAGGRLRACAPPETLLATARGRVWSWNVAPDQVTPLKQRFLVSGAARRNGGVQVRVLANEAPAAESVAAEPSLEDAYLLHVAAGDGAHTPDGNGAPAGETLAEIP